ncbi:probable E3 ubiquitin-protein ligase RHC1A [Carica papaya]|uniref:probable E3 ubiquitin-protein ligase RHC1A n=1 Tax=Carica papaya TaxID=3649 RepID=UPI000B8C8CD5|nr:probable E3 ubiquitin-protein ligase RHC1A [Carica papaya]
MSLEVDYHLRVNSLHPPSESPLIISFQIFHVHRECIEVEDETFQLSPDDWQLVGSPSVEINVDSFGSHEVTEIISLLYDFDVPPRVGRNLVQKIQTELTSKVSLLVEITKFMNFVHKYGEEPEITRIVDEFRANLSLSEPKTTPAANSAIEALRKFVYDEEDDDCKSKQHCTICIEDFVRGSELNEMPCSHLFHPDCIVEWLQVNHTCPLCRHPLPCES